jgi:mRNA-degrading endonuclease RelE of RelBE toxin-antitoxin system
MYEILLSSAAVQDYKKIPDSELEKINKTIDQLEKNPRPQGSYKNFREKCLPVRSGNYRLSMKSKIKNSSSLSSA